MNRQLTSAQNTSNYSRSTFVSDLMCWHKNNALDFVWRRYKSPYKILVTEILLRKTNAEKVHKLIDDVIERIGSVKQLISIEEDELTDLLKPFGMQKRKASELKRLALILEADFDGNVPASSEELMSLPGVGQYIAHAVLASGHLQPKAVVDTNVIRVYSRYFGLSSTRARPRDDPRVWEFAQHIFPERGAPRFNYAVIDFAKQICTARSPRCLECPMINHCLYFSKRKSHR